MNSESLCTLGDQPGKERGGERETAKARHGDQSSDEQRCFNQHGVGIYTVVSLSKDKD